MDLQERTMLENASSRSEKEMPVASNWFPQERQDRLSIDENTPEVFTVSGLIDCFDTELIAYRMLQNAVETEP